jgi:hypothetical protein
MVLGGAGLLGRAIAAEVRSHGRIPVIADVQEAADGDRTVYADLDSADLARELHRAVDRLQALVLCASIEESRPGILKRCTDDLVTEGLFPSLVVGVAQAHTASTEESYDQALWADRELIRCLRRLEIVHADIGVSTVLHGRLAPAFEDCRGEVQELDDPGSLLRQDVAASVGFVLTRPTGQFVRHLQVDPALQGQATPARSWSDESTSKSSLSRVLP